MSCFVGQNIACKTGHHEINIHISILTQFISFCYSLYFALNSENTDIFTDLNTFKSLLNMAFVATCTANSVGFFIRFFSTSIFRNSKTVEVLDKNIKTQENSKNSGIATGSAYETLNSKKIQKNIKNSISDSPHIMNLFVLKILKLPIDIISDIFIKIYQTIFPQYKKRGKVQVVYLTGSDDAFIGLCCYFSSYLIVKVTESKIKENLYSFLLLMTSLNLFIMTKIKKRMVLFIFFLATSIFSTSANQFSKSFLKKSENDNNLIVASFITELIVHNIINQICTRSKFNSLIKLKIYILL